MAETSPQNRLLASLTRKIGPLPAWAWAAIPAGAYVAWSYYQAAQAPEVDETADDFGGQPSVADYGIQTGGASLPSYGAVPGGTSNIPIDSVETPDFTNEQWFRQASNWLIEEGVISTDTVTALNAYLYGTPEQISGTQMNALQRAIMRFGAAPDPAFVPSVAKPGERVSLGRSAGLMDGERERLGTAPAGFTFPRVKNVKAIQTGPKTVNVTWTAIGTTKDNYSVRVRKGIRPITTRLTFANSYSVGGLEPGTYSIAVRIHDRRAPWTSTTVTVK